MENFLGLTVAGLATGAVYAVAASGLVVTYSTTGTFNFAHGAIGMIAAFFYWQLHDAWGVPTPVALALVLLIAGPLFGAGLERLIMRRLDGTSDTTRMVVTISLLLGLLGVSVVVWDPQVNRPIRQFFQGNVVELAGVRIPWYQLVALSVAGLVAIGLRVLLYSTLAGVTMRAAVDSPSLTALTGARPERSSMLAWSIGCSLAALSGILIAPTLTLSAVPLTLLIVNAYGAAVFGRLKSLPMTFVGAMAIGLSTSYGLGYLADLPATARPYVRGLVDALPAIILFVVALALPAGRLGEVRRSREVAVTPTWKGSIALAVGVVLASAMVVPLLSGPDLVSIGKVWGLAIIGLSMVPLIGWSGQLSLAQLSFAGLGAVAYAHLGWAHPLALVWAALIGALAAVVVAVFVIRLQGIYVALATAAFAVLADRWLLTLPEFSIGSHSFTVFQNGSLEVIRPRFLGLDLTAPEAYFIYSAVIFALAVVGVAALRRSVYGARLIAVKEGPAAAATSGIDVTLTKLAAFVLAGGLAGVGGAIVSGASPVNPSTFDFVAGLPVLLTMVIAGISSIAAPIIAGVFLGSPLMSKALAGLFDFEKWQNILVGLAGVGLGNNPNGLTSDARPFVAAVKRDRPLVLAVLAALVSVWCARVAGAFGNGPYLALTLIVIVAAPLVARYRLGRGGRLALGASSDPSAGPGSDRDGEVPPELMGLSSPFNAADEARLDEAIDLASGLLRAKAEASHA